MDHCEFLLKDIKILYKQPSLPSFTFNLSNLLYVNEQRSLIFE